MGGISASDTPLGRIISIELLAQVRHWQGTNIFSFTVPVEGINRSKMHHVKFCFQSVNVDFIFCLWPLLQFIAKIACCAILILKSAG